MHIRKAFACFGTLALAVGLSLSSLTACSKGGDTNTSGLSDEEILAKIAEANPTDVTKIRPSIMSGTVALTMDMEDLDNSSVNMDYIIEQLPDPTRYHMTMKTTSFSEIGEIDLDMYAEQNSKGNFTTYTTDGSGQWEKKDMSAEEMGHSLNPAGTQIDMAELQRMLGEDNFVIERDSDSYTVSIDIPKDKADILLNDIAQQQGLGTFGAANVETYKIVTTYDTKTFYNTAIDLVADYTVTIAGVTVPVSMTMKGDIENDPPDLKIEIPAEAKKAT